MKQNSPAASIGRLIALTVVFGVGVGVIAGRTLALLLGTEDRTLLAALTAAITASVTTVVVSSLMRPESEPTEG
jgi:hypothetical protein